MNDVRFHQLGSLHWLWLVLVVAIVVVVGLKLRGVAIRRFASAGLLDHLIGNVSVGRRVVKSILPLMALVALVVALMDPRWGVTFRQVQQRGVDLMVVLDVSRSMLAEDAVPNRLERARHFIGDLVDEARGDRVGLITFAGIPEVRCPLTVDDGAFRLALDTVVAESGGRGGSLLGDAIRLAAASFTDALPDHKAIVVFTDGEDHGSYPREAVEAMRDELEIPVYTIGLGDTNEGGRIPVEENGRRRYLVHEGQEVWSIQNASLLQDIALASGGAYVPVGTGHVEMSDIYAERIEPMAKREFETTQQRLYHVRYQWFAIVALVLLLAESLIGERRSTRVIPRSAVLAALGVGVMLAVGATPVTPPRLSASDATERASEAMADGRYAEALAYYDMLREARPEAAEVPYNMGVAAYRLEDYEQAARLFDEAARLTTDPTLRAKSAYNMGTSTYQAARQDNVPTGDADVQAQMDAASGQLESAIEQLRRAVAADPTNRDARANAEQAQRRLNALREMQQQQQQEQQQGEDGEPSDDEQSSDDQQQQQGQDQQNQEGQQGQQGQQDQQQDQQDQQQGQQGQGESDEQQDQQQQTPSEGEDEPEDQGDESPQDQEGDESDPAEQSQQRQSEADDAADEQDGRAGQPGRMSRDEAERLLQSVRDKARRRAQEQAEAKAADASTVIRDW